MTRQGGLKAIGSQSVWLPQKISKDMETFLFSALSGISYVHLHTADSQFQTRGLFFLLLHVPCFLLPSNFVYLLSLSSLDLMKLILQRTILGQNFQEPLRDSSVKNRFLCDMFLTSLQISIQNNPSHYMPLGNCKLIQRDITRYPLERLKFKTLTTSHTGERWDNRTSHSVLGKVSLQNTVSQLFTKLNILLTIKSSCHIIKYFLK